ncbi:SDR family oxidoreductase [Flavisphingomonas formosensis]|uniref:SDR family oxidoreductase n=1 Tax=Flavisphingomonas formosensis TaxID=861534 RepID=UPI0012FA7208|nr:SDR family oxidoreductase [Sphingomonas formosensis]
MMLRDKVIFVSGVGPGLGIQLGRAAVREGARVVLAARSIERVEAMAAQLRAEGAEAIAARVDVAREEECAAAAEVASSTFGRIDGLVNSARLRGPMRSLEDIPIEAWSANYDVTCLGALRMTRAVLPAMKAAGGGSIVNVGTISQVRPYPGEADYATAKTALGGLTRYLAKELGGHGVRVNCTRMGYMWGPSIERFFRTRSEREGRPAEELVDEVARSFPLGVIPTDAQCANAVLFLLSDLAGAITGASLDVNGGEWMTP